MAGPVLAVLARVGAGGAKVAGRASATVGRGALKGSQAALRTAGRTARGGARAGNRTAGNAHRSQTGAGRHGQTKGRAHRRFEQIARRRAGRSIQRKLGQGGDDDRERRPSSDTARGRQGSARAAPADLTDVGAHARKALRGGATTLSAARTGARITTFPLRLATRLPAAPLRLGTKVGKRRGGRNGSKRRSRRRLFAALGLVVGLLMLSSMPSLMSLDLGDLADVAVLNIDDMVEAFVDAGVPEEHAEDFVATAALGIDPRLVAAVAWQESIHFDEDVIACQRDSPDGAQGIMQFVPATAAERDVDPCMPDEAIPGGARYLLEQQDSFSTWDLALAAYNAGPGVVGACTCIPQNGETEDYVPAVTDRWAEYKETVPEARLGRRSPSGGNPGGPMGSVERYTESAITETMQALLDEAIPEFGQGKRVGCYRSGGGGDHPLGKACDFIMQLPLNEHPSLEYLEHGWRLACWMVQNAESLGVKYVIWQDLIWEDWSETEQDRRCSANRAGDGWTEYTCLEPPCNLQEDHYDHVHVSVH